MYIQSLHFRKSLQMNEDFSHVNKKCRFEKNEIETERKVREKERKKERQILHKNNFKKKREKSPSRNLFRAE